MIRQDEIFFQLPPDPREDASPSTQQDAH